MRPHLFVIMQNGNDRATLAMPAQHDVDEILRSAAVDGGEGLVENDEGGILQKKPRKQRALELSG